MQRRIHPGQSVIELIVRSVADATDRDPLDLQPFAETIEVEAIELLFSRSSTDGPFRLTLCYEGCKVTVDREFVTVEEISPAQRTEEVPSRKAR